MSIRIRLEEPADREAALAVERAAFDSDEEPRIVEVVRDLEGSFALVAGDGGEVLGHIQFSRAHVGDSHVLALGPVAVLPQHQGRGIGSELIRAGLDRAGERGEVAVILIGDPDFYARFGFEPAATYGLANPFAGPQPDGSVIREEHFMIAILRGRGRDLGGQVRWHPAFDQPG